MRQVPVWVVPGVLPVAMVSEALRVIEHAVRIDRDGAGPGSLSDEGLHYSMVNGDTLKQYAWPLHEYLHETIPAMASAVIGEPLGISPDVPSAINVNVVAGRGSRYEPHTDPCPWSCLIFVTSHDNGGQLFLDPPGAMLDVKPTSGTAVLFAGNVPHWVAPLTTDGIRVSIPVALYPAGTTSVERDPELNAHIGLDAPVA